MTGESYSPESWPAGECSGRPPHLHPEVWVYNSHRPCPDASCWWRHGSPLLEANYLWWSQVLLWRCMAAWEGGKEGHSLSEAEHEPFLEEKSSILLHPPTSSPVLAPQIWVRTSGRWEGIEVWSDKPQVQRRKRPQDRLLLQGTLKTVPTLDQIEIIFMQIPTRALLVASGKKASSEGKELLTSPWKVAQSCPTLCDPVDCSPPGSSIHGIS